MRPTAQGPTVLGLSGCSLRRQLALRVLIVVLAFGTIASGQDDAIQIVRIPDGPAPTVDYLQVGKMLRLTTSADVKNISWIVHAQTPSTVFDSESFNSGQRFNFTGTPGSYTLTCVGWRANAQTKTDEEVRMTRTIIVQDGPSPGPTPPGPSPTNRPPIASGEAYTTSAGQSLSVASPGVLANDSDPDGDPIMASISSTPDRGELTLNRDGSFVYLPQAGFAGTDKFEYTVRDPSGAQSNRVATTITVTAPTDTFQQALQAAYNQETSANKKIHAGKLAAFYRAAAVTTCYDDSLATSSDWLAAMQRTVKTIGLPTGSLPKVTTAIADELDKALGTAPNTALSKEERDKRSAACIKVATGLEALR